MGRRADLLEAGLHVLATTGLKGLTHRAVDAQAGLPAGSTANVFRDRESLVRALLDETERRDRAQFELAWGSGDPPEPQTAEELARVLADGLVRMAGPTAEMVTRARLILSLGYPDDARSGHRRLLHTLTQLIGAAGIGDPANRAAQIAALLDGSLLHALTVATEPLDSTALTLAIARLLD